MREKNISIYSLLSALGVAAYIFVVAVVMHSGNKIFGNANGVLGVMGALMLFSLSAGVVGGLVLGKPLMLYLDGAKKEGLRLFIYTMGWLVIFLIVVFAAMALI